MEVFFNKVCQTGVSRLGGYNLPGRLIEADFGHLGTKPVASVGPVDARRKGFPGEAFPLPLSLVSLLPLSLCAFCGPSGPSRGCDLGGKDGVWDTNALRDRDQRDGLRGSERADLPSAGLNPRRGLVVYTTVAVATLSRKVSDSHKLDKGEVYSLASPVDGGMIEGVWSVARALPSPTEVG